MVGGGLTCSNTSTTTQTTAQTTATQAPCYRPLTNTDSARATGPSAPQPQPQSQPQPPPELLPPHPERGHGADVSSGSQGYQNVGGGGRDQAILTFHPRTVSCSLQVAGNPSRPILLSLEFQRPPGPTWTTTSVELNLGDGSRSTKQVMTCFEHQGSESMVKKGGGAPLREAAVMSGDPLTKVKPPPASSGHLSLLLPLVLQVDCRCCIR